MLTSLRHHPHAVLIALLIALATPNNAGAQSPWDGTNASSLDPRARAIAEHAMYVMDEGHCETWGLFSVIAAVFLAPVSLGVWFILFGLLVLAFFIPIVMVVAGCLPEQDDQTVVPSRYYGYFRVALLMLGSLLLLLSYWYVPISGMYLELFVLPQQYSERSIALVKTGLNQRALRTSAGYESLPFYDDQAVATKHEIEFSPSQRCTIVAYSQTCIAWDSVMWALKKCAWYETSETHGRIIDHCRSQRACLKYLSWPQFFWSLFLFLFVFIRAGFLFLPIYLLLAGAGQS